MAEMEGSPQGGCAPTRVAAAWRRGQRRPIKVTTWSDVTAAAHLRQQAEERREPPRKTSRRAAKVGPHKTSKR